MTPKALAVHLILTDERSVLLLRRSGTGWQDGKYTVIAGHVEPAECPVAAILREAKEEADVTIDAGDLRFAHVTHRSSADGQAKVDLWFWCDQWKGVPRNAEPEKCDNFEWFTWECLPPDLVEHVRAALALIKRGCLFSTISDGELRWCSDTAARLRAAAS